MSISKIVVLTKLISEMTPLEPIFCEIWNYFRNDDDENINVRIKTLNSHFKTIREMKQNEYIVINNNGENENGFGEIMFEIFAARQKLMV